METRFRLKMLLSFNPEDMRCLVCSKGHQLSRKRRGEASLGNQERVVFFLPDQGFPASLLRGEDSVCPYVIRMEYGKVTEMVELFLRTVHTKFVIAPGSALVVSSVSQMATGGLADYIWDLVA